MSLGSIPGTSAFTITESLVSETSRAGAQSPIDTKLRVRDISCNVVGLLTAKGQSTLGQDQDDVVLMPLSTVQRRMTGKREIQAIWISAESEEAATSIPETLGPLMRERRNLSLNEEDDFTIRDMREIAETVQGVTAVLTAFLGAIAAVSLVVGGIGIMNIMLVSVTERTREIGIRLAIGARETDVLSQFLIEAVLLSAAGGVIGIVLGLLMSWGAAGALGIPFVLDPLIVVVSFGFSAVVGVVFGFFPARRAARLADLEPALPPRRVARAQGVGVEAHAAPDLTCA